MPGRAATFVVLGLTAGRAFTANPCLPAQVSWARAHGVRAAAYLVPTYPTRAQLGRWGGSGPYRADTLRGRVLNVGVAEARDALAVLRRSGLRVRAVWIDVEQGV